MVTIAHVSDTHLGKRPGDVRDKIIDRQYRPLEDDFYLAWRKVVQAVLSRRDEIDFLVHSGDLFDSPWSQNPRPPPEAARNTVAETLQELREAQIPVIVVEGNHGFYMGYHISTIDHYAIAFDNVHVFTYWDFVDAFKQNKPLKKEVEDTIFFGFPYVDPSFLESVEVLDQYRRWIRNITVEKGEVNIAVAHGMQTDKTLDPNLLNLGFDYIALGHDHIRREVARNAWYAGSTERWSFKEADDEKGFLIVQIEPSENPEIQPVTISLRRPMINQEVEIETKDMAQDIISKLDKVLDEYGLKSPYRYTQAARVRLALKGATSYETMPRLYSSLEEFKHEGLTSPDINVVQLKVGKKPLERVSLPEAPTYQDLEYLIENPEQDLRSFLQQKEIDETYDLDLMVKLFKNALKELGGIQ